MGVVQKGLRPGVPANSPPALGMLMEECWQQDSRQRPSFRELTPRLQVRAISWRTGQPHQAEAPLGLLCIARPVVWCTSPCALLHWYMHWLLCHCSIMCHAAGLDWHAGLHLCRPDSTARPA